MKPPVLVRIQGLGWEAVVEVSGMYGDAGGVANRLRATGVACRRRGLDVLVSAASEVPK